MKTNVVILDVLFTCLFLGVETILAETSMSSPSRVSRGVQSKTVAEPCVDDHKLCSYWGLIGDCTRNAKFMEATCRRSCGICMDDQPDACRDTSLYCGYWAHKGHCWTNPGFMFRNCRISCHVCSFTEGEDSPCLDSHSMCGFWYLIGDCTRNVAFMETVCKRSCGLCDVGANIPGFGGPKTHCDDWLSMGLCQADPGFMTLKCKDLCQATTTTTAAITTTNTTPTEATTSTTTTTTTTPTTTTTTPTTTTTTPTTTTTTTTTTETTPDPKFEPMCPDDTQPSRSVGKRLLEGQVSSPCMESPGIVAMVDTLLSYVSCNAILLSPTTLMFPPKCLVFPGIDYKFHIGGDQQSITLSQDYINANKKEVNGFFEVTLPNPAAVTNCSQYACQYDQSKMAGRVNFRDCFITSYGGRSKVGLGIPYVNRMVKLDVRNLMTEPCCDALLERASEGYFPPDTWITGPGVRYSCMGTQGSTCEGDFGAPIYCKAKDTDEIILVGVAASAPCTAGDLLLAVDLTHGDISSTT